MAGTISRGIKAPIIREGDDIVKIVADSVLAAVEQAPIWKDFFYAELTTGLRLGELCGLMWPDFDARNGTLSVNRTIHKEKGGRLVTGDTKTYAGIRGIVLPGSTAELLWQSM